MTRVGLRITLCSNNNNKYSMYVTQCLRGEGLLSVLFPLASRKFVKSLLTTHEIDHSHYSSLYEAEKTRTFLIQGVLPT